MLRNELLFDSTAYVTSSELHSQHHNITASGPSATEYDADLSLNLKSFCAIDSRTSHVAESLVSRDYSCLMVFRLSFAIAI